MRQIEGKTKSDIRRYLESRGAFWSNVTGGSFSKPGDPDLIVCYKGYYIGMEGKTLKGKYGELQKDRREEILAAGGICMRVMSVKDAEKALAVADERAKLVEDAMKAVAKMNETQQEEK